MNILMTLLMNRMNAPHPPAPASRRGRLNGSFAVRTRIKRRFAIVVKSALIEYRTVRAERVEAECGSGVHFDRCSPTRPVRWFLNGAAP